MSTSFSSARTRRMRHCCSVMSCSRRWGRKRCMTASRALIKSIGRERPKDRIGTATAAPLSSELNRSAFATAVFFVNDAILLTHEPRFEFRRNDVLIKEGYHNRNAAGSGPTPHFLGDVVLSLSARSGFDLYLFRLDHPAPGRHDYPSSLQNQAQSCLITWASLVQSCPGHPACTFVRFSFAPVALFSTTRVLTHRSRLRRPGPVMISTV